MISPAQSPTPRRRILRTPEDAFHAGQELSRTDGVELTDAQVSQIAALLRPYYTRRARELDQGAA